MSDIRGRLFSASKRRIATLDLPPVGEIRIRSLTAAEMRALRESFVDEAGKPTKRLDRINELLVAACICDEHEQRVLDDSDAMGGFFDELDGGVFASLYATCRKHTNFAADPDWRAIENAAKN